MSETSNALGMQIPEPHVDTWNASMERVTDALEKIDAFAGDMATIEVSPSVGDHAVGELLIYSGRLYKVIDEVTVGDVLSIGVNIQSAKIGLEVEETARHFWADEDGAHIESDTHSLSVGEGASASSDNQTVIGKWNVEDDSGTYALIIGNGTDNDARSDALLVDWNGNVDVRGDIRTIGHVLASTTGKMALQATNPNSSTTLYRLELTIDGTATVYTSTDSGSSWTGKRLAFITGDTFTGAVNFANNTWNKFGDDVQIGDRNISGALCVQGLNGTTRIRLIKYSDTASGDIYFDGAGMHLSPSTTIHGTVYVPTSITLGNKPSSDVYSASYTIRDSANSNNLARIQAFQLTNGMTGGVFGAVNKNANTGSVFENTIQVRCTTTGDRVYYVADAANFRSAIGAAASSDRRLKSDISTLGEDAVEFIDALEPCVYTINGERQVGLIAQDVYEADTWGTRMAFETKEGVDGLDDWEKMKDGSPTWKLDYIRIIPPLVATVKSQARRIEELEDKVSRLEKLIESIMES